MKGKKKIGITLMQEETREIFDQVLEDNRVQDSRYLD